MTRVAEAVAATFFITYFVPLPVYGALSALTGLEPPAQDAVGLFMLSVAIMKIGVAGTCGAHPAASTPLEHTLYF